MMHGYPYPLTERPTLRGSFVVFTTPDGSIHECIGPSEKRRALVFSADLINAGNVVVRPSNNSGLTFGFNVAAGQAPVILRYEDVGSIVQGAFQAQASAGGNIIMIMECFEE